MQEEPKRHAALDDRVGDRSAIIPAKKYKDVTTIYQDYRAALNLRIETLACTQIQAFFHDVFLYKASGFIYQFAEHFALVTNWHVLSGINPITKVRRNTDGMVPNRIKFSVVRHDAIGKFTIIPVDIPLRKNGQSIWYERAVDDMTVDIAAIDLKESLPDFEKVRERLAYLPGGHMLVAMDAQTQQASFAFHAYPLVGAEVFILGYPRGIGQGAFPIWKRGSVASEPLYGAVESGAPVILIDAQTKDGMSGAPVLFFGREVGGIDGRGENSKDNAWLVGVYAGREGVTPDENDMAIGRIWKTEEMEKLFNPNSRRPGLYLPFSG